MGILWGDTTLQHSTTAAGSGRPAFAGSRLV
jgi:hypothetical protein